MPCLATCSQVPEDSSKDAKGQTEEVLKCIDDLLARAGTDKTRILMAQVFLTDMAGASRATWRHNLHAMLAFCGLAQPE